MTVTPTLGAYFSWPAAAGTASGEDKIHGTEGGNAQVNAACVPTKGTARVWARSAAGIKASVPG